MTTMHKLPVMAVGAILVACVATQPFEGMEEVSPSTLQSAPQVIPASTYPQEVVAQGRYLVSLLRCGACHTDGALVGTPDPAKLLAGSSVGIAYTSPVDNPRPGVVYPANLTPDPKTGLGGWSEQQIIDLVRTGAERHGGRALGVMPYAAYAELSDADAGAIAAYLLSLPPVRHEVPYKVGPGQRAPAPFVYFGVYRSRR